MQDKNKFMENQEKSRKETGEARFRKRQRDSIGSRFVGASLATIKMKPEDAKKVATFLDEKKNFLVYLKKMLNLLFLILKKDKSVMKKK